MATGLARTSGVAIYAVPSMHGDSGRAVCVEMHPHRSLGHSALITTMATLGGITLGAVGLVVVFTGAWPALIFAAAVVVLACACFLQNDRQRLDVHEVILDDDDIHITLREHGRETHARLPRYWTRARLREPRDGSESSRLLLEYAGNTLEIGHFLTDTRRRDLAATLCKLVGPMGASPDLPQFFVRVTTPDRPT